MKLYDIPPKTYVKVITNVQMPPASPFIKPQDIIFFDHLDGMASVCLNSDGHVVHLIAWAEVETTDKPLNFKIKEHIQ